MVELYPVGITFSCFDMLHAGHILMLNEAKMQCEKLYVGLQTDPTIDRPEKNKPVQSLTERYIQVAGVRFVDAIIPYQTEADLIEILTAFSPIARFIGADYLGKDFTGKDLPYVTTIYNSRDHDYSTTALRKKIQNNPI